MGFSAIFDVIKEIILDWRLIVAFVVVLLYLNFVFYVSKYKKKQSFKPKRIIKKSEASSAGGNPVSESSQNSESSAEDTPPGDDFV